MDQEVSTPNGGESTLDRLESFLSADDDPQEQSEPSTKEADATADEPKDVDVQEQESETPTEYQLADVAKLLGADESALDVDEDGAIVVKTKIDGEEGRVKFVDLIKDHQLRGHAEKQVREAADVRKETQEWVQQKQQELQMQEAVSDSRLEAKAIVKELSRLQAVDLNALWDSDPVQAGKINQHIQTLDKELRRVVGGIDQAVQQIDARKDQEMQALLAREKQALISACEDWKDAKVASREMEAIKADLRARGYRDNEFLLDIKNGKTLSWGLTDHRTVLMARDAMLYRAQKAANVTAEKQVRIAPKIVKPGSTASRNTNQIQKIHQEVRRTGSKQSVADYLLATGKV